MKKALGLIIIAFGGLYLLNTLDILKMENISDMFFPAVLLMIGIASMIDKKRIDMFGLAVFTLGSLYLFSAIGMISTEYVWAVFFPFVLILVGLTFVFGTPKDIPVSKSQNKYSALFSGVEGKNENDNYENSEVEAIFGGAELDYRKIKIKGNVAYITVTAIFGGVTLMLPEDVKITVVGTPIFGGCENKAISDKTAKKEIIVNYTAVFGGVEIKN